MKKWFMIIYLVVTQVLYVFSLLFWAAFFILIADATSSTNITDSELNIVIIIYFSLPYLCCW